MKITDQVEIIVNNSNIPSSKFFNDYQTLMSKYNVLIEKGIIAKRQSQLCSISDKIKLISLNCNYYSSDKR